MFDYGSYNGFPFKSAAKLDKPPDLRESDVELAGSVEVYVLDLSNPEDLIKYQTLRGEEGNGLIKSVIERQWVPENKNWKILVEAVRYYMTFKKNVV